MLFVPGMDDGIPQYWQVRLTQVGRPSAFHRHLMSTLKAQHGEWPTPAQWVDTVTQHASDDEREMIKDFQTDHGGRLPTEDEWEQLVLAYAVVGDPTEVRWVRRTEDNPTMYAVERSPALQAMWGPAVRKEIGGGVENGSTPFVTEDAIREGGYQECQHTLVLKRKRSGELHARSGMHLRLRLLSLAQPCWAHFESSSPGPRPASKVLRRTHPVLCRLSAVGACPSSRTPHSRAPCRSSSRFLRTLSRKRPLFTHRPRPGRRIFRACRRSTQTRFPRPLSPHFPPT